MQKFPENIPLSLYIHLPWCVRKCPYCDFNSHTAPSVIPEELYVNALIEDLEEHLPRIQHKECISIFLGGGTPSLFSGSSIGHLLNQIAKRIPFSSTVEITLEANPGTVDEARFTGFYAAGVNRLSLGIQSFQNDKLQSLGRIHHRDDALRAIDIAKRAGFTHFNLDLMHGLPHQSVEDALADLHDACAAEPTHISWYQLTIEPQTLFHRYPPALPKEEILFEIQQHGYDLLKTHGFEQYEVSAYSQKRECIHNRNYWEFGDYLGIGAGAHSKITDTKAHVIQRHWQVKNPRDYLDPTQKYVGEQRTLSEKESLFEFMLNALRLTHGIPFTLFTERTGLPQSTLLPLLATAKQRGLLEDNPEVLRPSALGQRFLDDLIGLFI